MRIKYTTTILGNPGEMITFLTRRGCNLSREKNNLHCCADNINLFHARVPVPILLSNFCLFVIVCFLLSGLLKSCGYDLARLTSLFAHQGNVGVVVQALGLQGYI